MNGIEKITNRINADAEERVSRIVSEASEKAKKISEEYKKKAEAIEKEERERANEEAEALRARLLGAANLESKKMLLAKKQELITRAFDTACENLKSLRGDELADVLVSLALRAADDKGGEIILSKVVRDELGAKISEGISKNPNLKLSDEVRDIDGLVLKCGNTEVNCTFDSLVSQKREDLSRDIADILFS